MAKDKALPPRESQTYAMVSVHSCVPGKTVVREHCQGQERWAGCAGEPWEGSPEPGSRVYMSITHPPLGSDLLPVLSQGAMAATYSALNSSKPTPQLKPIESSILAQRRVRKLPSTTL